MATNDSLKGVIDYTDRVDALVQAIRDAASPTEGGWPTIADWRRIQTLAALLPRVVE